MVSPNVSRAALIDPRAFHAALNATEEIARNGTDDEEVLGSRFIGAFFVSLDGHPGDSAGGGAWRVRGAAAADAASGGCRIANPSGGGGLHPRHAAAPALSSAAGQGALRSEDRCGGVDQDRCPR